MTTMCEPIFKLLKKDQSCVGTDHCQREFESIKEYQLEPPIFLPPIEGRPLIMYLTVLDKIKYGGDSCLPRHFAKTNAKHKPAKFP